MKRKFRSFWFLLRLCSLGLRQSVARPNILAKWLRELDWAYLASDLSFKIGLVLLKRAPHFFADYLNILDSIGGLAKNSLRLSALRSFQKSDLEQAYALMNTYWQSGISSFPKWNDDTLQRWFIRETFLRPESSDEAFTLLGRALMRTNNKNRYFWGLAFAYSIGYKPRTRFEVGNRLFGTIPITTTLTKPNLLGNGPKKFIDVTVPRVRNSEPLERPCARLLVPERRAARLEGAVLIDGNQVLQNKCLVVYEPAANPNFGFVAGLQRVFSKCDISPTETVINYPYRRSFHLEKATLISGRCTTNYFHFLIEYLPKIPLLFDEGLLEAGSVVLFDAEMPAQHHEAVALLCEPLGLKVALREANSITHVASLIVVAPPTFHPDEEQFCFLPGSAVDADALLRLRDSILRRYESKSGGLQSFPRRVFFSRRSVSARRLGNEAEIEATAADLGFSIVDPASLSFLEQVHLFQTADTIMGPGGAAFATTLFARPGLELIAFTAEQNREYSMIGILAALVGADFSYVLGRPDRPRDAFNTQLEWRFSSYSVPIDELRRSLEERPRSFESIRKELSRPDRIL